MSATTPGTYGSKGDHLWRLQAIQDTQEWKIWVDPGSAVLLPLSLLRLAAGQVPSALPAGNQPPQTNYTTAHPGTLGASYSLAPAKYNEALPRGPRGTMTSQPRSTLFKAKSLLSSWAGNKLCAHALGSAGLRAPIWLSDCGTRNRQCSFQAVHTMKNCSVHLLQ